MRRVFANIYLGFLAGFCGSLPFAVAQTVCFDAAISDGSAAKDVLTSSLIVTQMNPTSDTLMGVGIKGSYYGCRANRKSVTSMSKGTKKLSLYLPLKNASVQGFEVDVSTESGRILAARAIQVPWDVVDRSKGVTAVCAPSNATSFEVFLYSALKRAGARRCTEMEIKAFVGKQS